MLLPLCALLFALALLSACSASATPTPALTPVTVQLRWTHQAQFAGLYAAEQKGYYAAEGLAVKFLPGGAGVDLFKPVLDGAAQFGLHGADALIAARADGKPVKALAVIYRRSPVVFVALSASGIRRPEDFVGKTISVGGGSGILILRSMVARVGIREDQFEQVPLIADLKPFYAREVDVVSGFMFDQPFTARRDGYAVNTIYPDDYGVHFYADTLYATDALAASQPELIRRFLRATLKGWTYAVENPTEVGALVKQYNPDADIELENAKMLASLPLVNTGEDKIGWMRPERWAAVHETLQAQKVLTQTLDVTQVYTMQFLQELYGK